MKMMELDDLKLEEHYAHIKDKPFFGDIKKYMKSSPVIILVLEGTQVIEACRIICGSTKGIEADAGTIRGDLAMSNFNLVHASDSLKSSEEEIKRLFNEDELFDYSKLDTIMIYED